MWIGEDFFLPYKYQLCSFSILVFGRGSVKDDVDFVTALYVDATFAITPPLFAQVFVVTGRRGSLVQPLFFVLMPNRREVTYKRVYDLLKEVKSICTGKKPSENLGVPWSQAGHSLHGLRDGPNLSHARLSLMLASLDAGFICARSFTVI